MDSGCGREDLTVTAMKTAFAGGWPPKSYVLERTDAGSGMKMPARIKPLSADRECIRRLYLGRKPGFYATGWPVMVAEPDEPDEVFAIRASAAGFPPSFASVMDGEGETVDFVDMETGESLVRARERLFRRRK